jgi:hypothetical protein
MQTCNFLELAICQDLNHETMNFSTIVMNEIKYSNVNMIHIFLLILIFSKFSNLT